MTFRSFGFCWVLLLAWGCSSLAVSGCKELAVSGIGKTDEFYVACANSLLKPTYTVTQYYGGDDHFGVLTLNVGSTGYFCAGTSEKSSCQPFPKGAVPYGRYKSHKSQVIVANISDSKMAYKEKGAIFRFPKSHGAVEAVGCFVVIQKSRDVVLGLATDRLYQSADCLVALERYISRDKTMLFR
jgi:hypothetical protein